MVVFHGNWNEDAEVFLNSFLECMGSADDEKRARNFIYYLQADSDADEWFEELSEREKKSWASIEVLFRKKWLKQEAISTKEVTTIENGPQVLADSDSPQTARKQVFSSHKCSKTSTSLYMMSNTPTKAKMTPCQGSEATQTTATSQQPFSPPAPSLAPKPPEIGLTQPVSSSLHLENNSPTRIATSQLLEAYGNGENAKNVTKSENSSYDIVFSSSTLSVTSSTSPISSTIISALEMRSSTSSFTQKVEKIEKSLIFPQITPTTPSPGIIGHPNDITRVYTSSGTPNDTVSQSPTLPKIASSSPTPYTSGHEKSTLLCTIFETQLRIGSPVHNTIVTGFKKHPAPANFMENCKKVEKPFIIAQNTPELIVSGHSECANAIGVSPAYTTIVSALKHIQRWSFLWKTIKKSKISHQKHPKSLVLEHSNWENNMKPLVTPFIPPTKHPCYPSGLYYFW